MGFKWQLRACSDADTSCTVATFGCCLQASLWSVLTDTHKLCILHWALQLVQSLHYYQRTLCAALISLAQGYTKSALV